MLINVVGIAFISALFISTLGAEYESAENKTSTRALNYPEITLNYSIDPCVDLYEHVCSRWKSEHPVPPDRTAFSKLTEAAEQIKPILYDLYMDPTVSKSRPINDLKMYFRSCIDMDEINRVKSSEFRAGIEKHGNWPLLMGDSWNASEFDLTQLLINFAGTRGYKVFVDFDAGLDLRNVSRWILNFDQRQMVMQTREYYLNSTYKAKLDAYRQYMFDVLWTLVEDNGSNRTRDELEAVVDELIQFDIQLAKLSKRKEERYDYDRLYNLKHLSDLNELAPAINWTRYLREVSPPELHSYYDSNPEIVINEKEYIVEISRLLQSTDPRILSNYAFWRYSHVFIIALDSRFQKIQDEFQRRLVGKEKRQLRWKECLIQTTENLAHISGAIYVREKFKHEDYLVAKTMIEELRASFIRTLKRSRWIAPKIKDYALKKARAMLPIIGAPEILFNDTALEEYYEDLSLNEEDSFAVMETKILLFDFQRRLKHLLKPSDRNDMEISAALVNAYNDQTNNKIIIPAAILQEPFFHRNYPKAAIYAAVGSIIGHEMGHAFDGQGRQFDVRGNLFNWWDDKTLESFTARAQCISNQFGKYPIKESGVKMRINGPLTRDENLADVVGLRRAYEAYRHYLTENNLTEEPWPNFKNYTNEQMFFLSFANLLCTSMTKEQTIASSLTDQHSPANWRINGVVSNMPQFAKAFNCPKDAGLNPSKRCEVW